jgi:2,4-dienoyl-CoA reductase-like NADH-dependent reductase (Old Yellow Enzyme family)
MAVPWETERWMTPEEEGWTDVVAPSAIPFADNYPKPYALDGAGIHKVVNDFVAATCRAMQTGFDLIEIHAAHGYLLHEFLSPLSNQRADEYGGSFENRVRLLLEIVEATRKEWPPEKPLTVRISATDWAEGGWDIDESVELAKLLKQHDVNLIDVSSGGLVPHVKIPAGPGYQTPFAERIKREADIVTGTVGMIIEPMQADHIIRTGQADLVLIAREMLRDPYWPVHAAADLHKQSSWPVQYLRAARSGASAREAVFMD